MVIATLGGALGYRYYQTAERRKNMVDVQIIPPVPVETAAVRRESRYIVGSFRGVIKPVRETTVSAKVGGTIGKVYFFEGDRVKKDEIVAVIEDEILKIALDEANARYNKSVLFYEDAKRDLKRKEELSKDKIISEEDFLKAELNAQIAFNEMKTLEADKERKIKDLEYAVVKAPFDGIISRIDIDEGETVFQATKLFSIMDISRLKIHFYVTDIEIPAFHIGLPLTFTVDAYPDKQFVSKVGSIDPGSDEDYLNFRITSIYVNDNAMLLPGMVIRIQARLGRIEDAFFVPADVVFQSVEGAFLFVVEDNIARQRYIALDRQIEDELVVTSGLQEGDAVIVTGYTTLQNGSSVLVVNISDNDSRNGR
jgi:membrane fusion protein (multidrug efflux system)